MTAASVIGYKNAKFAVDSFNNGKMRPHIAEMLRFSKLSETEREELHEHLISETPKFPGVQRLLDSLHWFWRELKKIGSKPKVRAANQLPKWAIRERHEHARQIMADNILNANSN